MYSKVHSIGIIGVEGVPILVEADVSDGLPGFSMVGYLSSQVREAQDRVRTALKNSGFRIPAKKITINLSPADIRKEGTAFDLPIAIAILSASGMIQSAGLSDCVFSGELGLNGTVNPVPGALSIIIAAKREGKKICYLPRENRREGVFTKGIQVIGLHTLKELTDHLNEGKKLSQLPNDPLELKTEKDIYDVDFSDIGGQPFLRRATEVAVAGMHNIMYIGPAGTGKTMFAKRIPTIMPSLSFGEIMEISKIYSVCGLLSGETPIMNSRPFRSPHHTISPQAFAGGGRIPRPGEITLASGGVLFLDELSEFQKSTIEILRQPLEEGEITISRSHGAYLFPAKFLLAAAMNPCPCGFYPDRTKCRCSESQVNKYLGRISKPILDRIDICAESSPVSYKELRQGKKGESSAAIRNRIERARVIQMERFRGTNILFNSFMKKADLEKYCGLHQAEELYLKQIYDSMSLSARGYEKILKIARTIADLEGSENISKGHLAEAAGLRSREGKFWGGIYG